MYVFEARIVHSKSRSHRAFLTRNTNLKEFYQGLSLAVQRFFRFWLTFLGRGEVDSCTGNNFVWAALATGCSGKLEANPKVEIIGKLKVGAQVRIYSTDDRRLVINKVEVLEDK